MSMILELRAKRAKAWDAAKAFLDSKRGADGLLSAEDVATYEKMEADVVNLGKEIDRLERQQALDAELNRAVNTPITGKPAAPAGEEKTGRATAEYRKSFWNVMRSKMPSPEVMNALQVGTDSEGGYLVPDEFERTLVEALEEQNIFRTLAHVIQTSSGDRKIPVVASKGSASWVDEEGAIPESDDSFGQVSIGAYKLGTMIKVSEELLNDSVFDLEAYISREFARRIGNKEEEAFFTGDGTGKPLGVLAETGGAEVGVTAAGAAAFTADEIFDLFYSLKAPYRRSAGYPVKPPGLYVRFHARPCGRRKIYSVRRPVLLLGGRPAGTLLPPPRRAVCADRAGGLPCDPARGRQAHSAGGREGHAAEICVRDEVAAWRNYCRR